MHYFEQIIKADVFVIYDDVQYTRSDWRNRNRIKTEMGWQWLTVPIMNNLHQKINEALIDNHTNWKKDHCKTIQMNYSKAPYFNLYWPELRDVYNKKWQSLLELDMHLVTILCNGLDIDHHFEYASKLNIEGDKTERLVNICQHFGADTYYSPKKSQSYLNIRAFNEAGINVEFQDYKHPVYSQLHGEFLAYMSVIDLMFNCGEESKWIITPKS